jgi:hypothetical protein
MVSPLGKIVSGGAIRLEISFRAKGASTALENGAAFYTDASAKAAYFDEAQRLVLTSAGAGYALPVAVSWAANDLVDIFIVNGGGAPG